MIDIQEVFKKYTDNYDSNIKGMKLKYNHSLAVSDLMGELAYRLNLDDEEIKLAKLIGLLHDIGRFEQLKKYESFSDIDTGFDHAEYGADYLFKEGHIRDYIDDNKYDVIIEKAIRNHNKYKIEDNLSEKELLFSKMIRDIDKTDIYKQMAIHNEFEFDADKVSVNILECIKNEELIDTKDVKTESDEILSFISFIFDYNFNESYDILVEEDNFDLFLGSINVKENSEKLFKKIKEIAFDKINRGV